MHLSAMMKVLGALGIPAVGWFLAPVVKAWLEGTPLSGLRSLFKKKKVTAGSVDLRIVVLNAPPPRWSIGAMATTPVMSVHFHARLAHQADHSLEIVQGYLKGTECVAPFLPITVSGQYDPSVMIHIGVRPILAKDGQSITRKVVLVDQFGDKHWTRPITFQPMKQSLDRFGSDPNTIKCFFCGKPISMVELSETSAVPAHKKCVK